MITAKDVFSSQQYFVSTNIDQEATIDPRGLWLEPIWHTPYDKDVTLSLLAD